MGEKVQVICPKCGGIIDEKTLKCKSCGAQYTKEEYEELENEILLKSWLVGGGTEFAEEGDVLKDWLEGDEGIFLTSGEEIKAEEMPLEAQEDVEKLREMLEKESLKNKELQREIEELNREIDELKRQILEKTPEDVKELKKREMELQEEIRKLRAGKGVVAVGTAVSAKEFENIIKEAKEGKTKELAERIRDLMKEIAERDKIIEELRNELAIREQELKKLKETLKFKEEEFARREEDLMYREKKMEAERRKLEMVRAEMENMDELALKRRLEDLQEEIRRKEEELKAKERYLRAKEAEIEAKLKGLAEKEVELSEEEVRIEISERKVRTGTRRLDDLLYGGFPMGSNVLIYGPPYSKKEVLVYSFIAEGLRKGVPAIWVLTDMTVDALRKEMEFVLPAYEEYESMGLVYYIDAYSKTIGDYEEIEGVIYLESQTDVEGIAREVDKIAKKIKEKSKYYRLAFKSLSTIMTYLDKVQLLRFLQPFTTKRARDDAVSLYLVEKGLHSEKDIEMVGSVMDGRIEFKIESHKTYLAVLGITEVQSRNWIEVSATKSGLTLGSFTLGHIK